LSKICAIPHGHLAIPAEPQASKLVLADFSGPQQPASLNRALLFKDAQSAWKIFKS
jgi:hypothetical protein